MAIDSFLMSASLMLKWSYTSTPNQAMQAISTAPLRCRLSGFNVALRASLSPCILASFTTVIRVLCSNMSFQ